MRILCIDSSLGASVALWDSEAKTPVLASRSSQDSGLTLSIFPNW